MIFICLLSIGFYIYHIFYSSASDGNCGIVPSPMRGWLPQRMRQSAAGALTRFRPGEQANVPSKVEVDDDFYLPLHG